jgi:DNA adenine methylase
MNRPLLRYPGSKFRLSPWIVQHFPDHQVYVEPFAGSAAVLLAKPRARVEVLNDTNADIVNLWLVLRTPTWRQELIELVQLTPYSRSEYETAWTIYRSPGYASVNPVERARNLLVRTTFGISTKGLLYKSGFDMRINDDAYVARLSYWRAYPEILAAAASRLEGVILENSDALGIMRRSSRPDALIYIDPPYQLESRSGRLYPDELTTAQHRLLLREARASQAFVLISGYTTRLYERQLDEYGWQRLEVPARTDNGGIATEVIWLNPRTARVLEDAKAQGHLFGAAELKETA